MKYSYREIKEELSKSPEAWVDPSLDEILEMMKDVMQEQGIGEHDCVWDWPRQDQRTYEAYDRAMSIL